MALKFKKGGYPVFDLVAPTGGVEAYEPEQYGDLLVIPQHDAAAGERYAAHIPGAEGQFVGSAHAAITVANGKGKKLYVRTDAANAGEISHATTSARFIGYGLNESDIAADGEIELVTMGLAGI